MIVSANNKTRIMEIIEKMQTNGMIDFDPTSPPDLDYILVQLQFNGYITRDEVHSIRHQIT